MPARMVRLRRTLMASWKYHAPKRLLHPSSLALGTAWKLLTVPCRKVGKLAKVACPSWREASNGRLSDQPTGQFIDTIDSKKVWWSGVAYLPGKNLLYAANRGTGPGPSNVVVFDAKTRQIITRIPVDINPYQLVNLF